LTKEPVRARPSSTIVLLRDGAEGLELFLIVRHREIEFQGGASVFPGGSLSDADSDAALRARSRGAERLDDEGFARAVAGVREGFEECGLLLAHPEGSDALLDAERTAAVQPYRAAVEQGEMTLLEVLEREKLELALDELVLQAHWVTPEVAPKQFDTWFYMARAPEGRTLAHDGSEAIDSIWIRPHQAIAEANAGARSLVFVTRLTILWLARFATVDEALAAARAREILTLEPHIEERDGARWIAIRADADYDMHAVPIEVARGGAWPDAPPM
jgi:hypothetical protein